MCCPGQFYPNCELSFNDRVFVLRTFTIFRSLLRAVIIVISPQCNPRPHCHKAKETKKEKWRSRTRTLHRESRAYWRFRSSYCGRNPLWAGIGPLSARSGSVARRAWAGPLRDRARRLAPGLTQGARRPTAFPATDAFMRAAPLRLRPHQRLSEER